jgi:hypothetical protein
MQMLRQTTMPNSSSDRGSKLRSPDLGVGKLTVATGGYGSIPGIGLPRGENRHHYCRIPGTANSSGPKSALLCTQVILTRRYGMAACEGFARIRKVLIVIGTLWAAACVAMFWSITDQHSVGEFLFFLMVAAVPIGAAFGLLWVIEGFALKKDTP